ncbi:metalloregulator ArsR/SmtB family transcription factor [Catenulispora subtropica]|uniref:Metalloregulator ArsR/SmtB family transcription factor n=1 Tax=Catenulispora subtropica TaxID=450798 RepID=A0ABN2R7Z0_9ACTN
MNTVAPIDRTTAETYATWFRALSDPTRIQVLNLLAVTGRPMTVGEITAALPIGQSTVSHHLKTLTETRFVLVEPVGTANLYRVNERCLTCFPSAADAVMGRQAPRIDDTDCEASR